MNGPGNRPCGSARLEPPQLLYVYREFWKPGTQAALDRIETEAARMCIELGCPHPYLGIESLSGSKEVWYLNGFASIEEQERVRDAYTKKNLFSTMSQYFQQREPFQSESGRDYYSTYRPELNHGAKWRMGEGRYLVIVVTKADLLSGGSVFETEDGTRFIVTSAKEIDEADRKLSAAGPDAKLFAIRPHFSMPAPIWVASDPTFWS